MPEKERIKDFSIRLYNENLSHEERAAKAREAEMERSMSGNVTTLTGKDVFGNDVDSRAKLVNDTERYSRVSSTPTLPAPTIESEEDIIARKTQSAQAEIDAINRVYQNKIAEQRNFNKGQERQTASINTLTGLAGSTEANRQATLTQDHGKKQIQAIQDEQAVMIAGILSDIREDAAEEARLQVQDARTAAQDAIKQREAAATKAVERVAVMSAAGVTAEGLKTTEPEVYASLVDLLGGENALQSYITLNRPVETIEDTRIEGGKYIQSFRNPITGETRLEIADLGLPSGYSKTIDAGNRILAVPDDWSGDPSELVTIEKGLTPDQIADNARADIKLAHDMSQKGGDVSTNISSLDPTDPNYIKNVLEASAGGKSVDVTTRNQLTKAATVLEQLGSLTDLLSDEETGPFLGILKENNPYDVKAQQIKAQLTAIVPNLARGVYGEVGVLTDTDIKNYTKTLGNLRSTTEVNKLLTAMTVRTVLRSLENQLEIAGGTGLDVSGLSNMYTRLRDKARSLDAELGVTEQDEAEEVTFVDDDGNLWELADDGKYYMKENE